MLAEIARQAGLDPAALAAAMAVPAVKDQLKANTEELARRGDFGSPTFFIGGDMYIGNDRLPLIRDALTRLQQTKQP